MFKCRLAEVAALEVATPLPPDSAASRLAGVRDAAVVSTQNPEIQTRICNLTMCTFKSIFLPYCSLNSISCGIVIAAPSLSKRKSFKGARSVPGHTSTIADIVSVFVNDDFLLDSMSNSISFRSVVWWRGQAFDLIWWQTYQGLSQRTRLEEKPARLPSRTQSGKVRRPQDQAHRSNFNIERNAQLGGTINNFQCTFFSKVCPPDSFQNEGGKRESSI